MSDRKQNLIWIDLEMTGLNPDRDRIIEIATIVTDNQLNVLAEGPVLAIRQPEQLLAQMDEWNTTTHGASGLLDRMAREGVEEREAEEQTLSFLQEWVDRGVSPMCGNSICQDRRFLWRGMPQLEEYFHYRNLDVSTIKELTRCWAPDILAGLKKQGSHQALADIRESIEELRYYRQHVFSI